MNDPSRSRSRISGEVTAPPPERDHGAGLVQQPHHHPLLERPERRLAVVA